MDFRTSIAGLIESGLERSFGSAEFDLDAIASLLEVPPDAAMGDYAFPCFRLAKALRKAPPAIADQLAGAVAAPFLARVEAVKGYLNFYIDRSVYAREVLSLVEARGDDYGGGDEGDGRTVCIDYSSINIAKRFHIGHLSTTMIGNSLVELYRFRGYRPVGINHLGDWGTQFGKMVCAYKKWGDRAAVEAGGVDEMVRLYVRFDRESEGDPALADEGRAWFKRIEDGDPEAVEIFNWFKEVTLRDARRVYDLLGVRFDSYAGESFYNDKMGRVVDELRAKNLLTESDGAWMVDLSDYGMPPCLILKKDGATLYATRDLAAALYRKDTYDFDLYVVAYQQDLHFRQLFKVLELMGYEAKDMERVLGMVSYEGDPVHPQGPCGVPGGPAEKRRSKGPRHHRGEKPQTFPTRTRSRGRWASARWCSSTCTTTASRTSTSGGIGRSTLKARRGPIAYPCPLLLGLEKGAGGRA